MGIHTQVWVTPKPVFFPEGNEGRGGSILELETVRNKRGGGEAESGDSRPRAGWGNPNVCGTGAHSIILDDKTQGDIRSLSGLGIPGLHIWGSCILLSFLCFLPFSLGNKSPGKQTTPEPLNQAASEIASL